MINKKYNKERLLNAITSNLQISDEIVLDNQIEFKNALVSIYGSVYIDYSVNYGCGCDEDELIINSIVCDVDTINVSFNNEYIIDYTSDELNEVNDFIENELK